MSHRERGGRPRGRTRGRAGSGAGRMVYYCWRVCSLEGKPTVAPLSLVTVLPRLLGTMVLPLLVCAATMLRAAWRALNGTG